MGHELIGDGTVELGPSHSVAGNPMRFASGTIELRADDGTAGTVSTKVVVANTAALPHNTGSRFGTAQSRALSL